MKRFFTWLLPTALLCCVLLAGCSKKIDEPIPTAQEFSPLTVTDMSGQTCTISTNPTKIVSLSPAVTEILYAIGAGDLVVGVDEQSYYPMEADKLPKVTTDGAVTMSAIVNLQPNLILYGNDLSEDTIAKLHSSNVTSVMAEAKTYDQIKSSIELLGSIVGKQDNAQIIIERMSTLLETTLAAIQGKTGPNSVYLVMGYGADGNKTCGADSLANSLIEMAAGHNIAADTPGNNVEIPIDRLISANPEIILFSDDLGEVKDFMRQEEYANLSAVINEKVYTINSDLITRPGPRAIDGLAELVNLFYPDAFKAK